MRILFDIGHPAHVHLFRNTATTLRENGHDIFISIRDRQDVKELLDYYGFEYNIASKPRQSLPGLSWELLEHDWKVLRLSVRNKINVLVGTSVAAAHVSRLLPGRRSAVFGEDDAQVVPLYAAITYPFAHNVVVPSCISDKPRKNYRYHDSYQELAYLHPDHFTPDSSILDELGVKDGERYFIVRLVALKAHHDVGHKGISKELQLRLISLLKQYGKVFITTEGKLPQEFVPYQMHIPPHRMHDAMAFASMMISDSQTMTAESAVLGVPAIRCNTFVGRLAYLEELEHRYQLTYGFTPNQSIEMIGKIGELLQLSNLEKIWQDKKRFLLKEKSNFEHWMTDFLNNMSPR